MTGHICISFDIKIVSKIQYLKCLRVPMIVLIDRCCQPATAAYFKKWGTLIPINKTEVSHNTRTTEVRRLSGEVSLVPMQVV